MIARAIIDIWNKLRLALKRYSENIEMVDPQLKNNAELVSILRDFE
jgi:hypothetical protein